MRVGDLIDYVQELKGSGLNGDEGVLYGPPHAEIDGVLVTWMATVPALETARRSGCNVVVCHETFCFMTQSQGLTPQHLVWSANRNRLAAAAAGGLTVVRVHGSLDLICIWDDFVAALGVENPTPGTGYSKVLPIPETTVSELIEEVKAAMGMAQVRVAGDPDKTVSVVGFPWGGLGLDSNIGYVSRCIDMGADVLIAGECDEYAMTFANDAGVPMIETGHAISENIGLKNFAARLRTEFPGLAVEFFGDTCPYVRR